MFRQGLVRVGSLGAEFASQRCGALGTASHVLSSSLGSQDSSDCPSTSSRSCTPYPWALSRAVSSQPGALGSQVRNLSLWPFRSSKGAAPAAQQQTGEQLGELTLSTEPAEPPPPPSNWPLTEDAVEPFSAIMQATEAAERVTLLAAKADAFVTASWFISAFSWMHNQGLPWWASIVAVNITMRLITFPLMVLSQKATANMVVFQHDMIKVTQLQQAILKSNDHQEQHRLQQLAKEEYKKQCARHGTDNPMKKMLVVPAVMFVNAGIFFSVFTGVSTLMTAKVPSITTGGMLWFPDLTVPDPYYGLPIVCCLVTLAMVEYGMNITGETSIDPTKQKQSKFLKNLMRAFSLGFLLMGGTVSAGTASLWVSNSCFGVVQGVLLRQPGFRALAGLPTLDEMKEMQARLAEQQAASAPKTTSAAVPGITTGEAPKLYTFDPTAKKAGKK